MWLLNAKTRRLEEFLVDKPPYVILSHTWADGEVSFRDIHRPGVKNMPGYRKISGSCKQALRSGFQWVWIDTCCINKESSAELVEAINSMYTWYWEAELCYAFLVDVTAGSNSTTRTVDFDKSNWFKRGWTLQELLAPAVIEFYDREWTFIGTKSSLVSRLQLATGIDTDYLLDRESVRNASIGTRFSWASQRVTTRPEDIAYCLIGLFDINMPLLYGEGTRAFYRLQLEIINASSDHTIFAWNPQPNDVFETTGMLAPSPRQFKDAAEIKSANLPRAVPVEHIYTAYNITNHGLRISLPRINGSFYGEYIGVLNCRLNRKRDPYIGVVLHPNRKEKQAFGNTRLVRASGSNLVNLSRKEASDNYPYSVYIQAESCLSEASSSVSKSQFKVDIGRVVSASWELYDVAIVRHDENRCWWLTDEDRITDRSFIITGDLMYIRFVIEGETSAIVVGCREEYVMLGVLEDAAEKTLDELSRAVKQLRDTGGLITRKDHAKFSLLREKQVVVTARKTGVQESVLWTAWIEIIP